MRIEKEVKCQCGCGEKFITTRKDKKYLNKVHQVRANNDRQYYISKMMGGITTILKNNFLIIRNLLKGKQKQTVSKEFLRGKGFDFNFITQIDLNDSKLDYFVFNYKLIFTSEDLITIINSN